jgi:hypothetical protein
MAYIDNADHANIPPGPRFPFHRQNHWDRLPKNIQTQILHISDPLTQYLNDYGSFSKTRIQTDESHGHLALQIWEEASKMGWDNEEDLKTLPLDAIDTSSYLWFWESVRSKRIYKALKERLRGFNYRTSFHAFLMKVAIQNVWVDEVVAEYALEDVITNSSKGAYGLEMFKLLVKKGLVDRGRYRRDVPLFWSIVYKGDAGSCKFIYELAENGFFLDDDNAGGGGEEDVTAKFPSAFFNPPFEAGRLLYSPSDFQPFVTIAASRGCLDIVKDWHRNNLPGFSTNTMDNAAEHGHLDVVEFLHHNREEGCTQQAMDLSAINGHLAVVQFLHEHRNEGCTPFAIQRAASGGHFEVVRYLHSNIPDFRNNRDLLVSIFVQAAACAHQPSYQAILRYLQQHIEGDFIEDQAILMAWGFSANILAVRFIFDDLFHGRHPVPIDALLLYAAQQGNLDLLKYCLAKRPNQTPTIAASDNNNNNNNDNAAANVEVVVAASKTKSKKPTKATKKKPKKGNDPNDDNNNNNDNNNATPFSQQMDLAVTNLKLDMIRYLHEHLNASIKPRHLLMACEAQRLLMGPADARYQVVKYILSRVDASEFSRAGNVRMVAKSFSEACRYDEVKVLTLLHRIHGRRNVHAARGLKLMMAKDEEEGIPMLMEAGDGNHINDQEFHQELRNNVFSVKLGWRLKNLLKWQGRLGIGRWEMSDEETKSVLMDFPCGLLKMILGHTNHIEVHRATVERRELQAKVVESKVAQGDYWSVEFLLKERGFQCGEAIVYAAAQSFVRIARLLLDYRRKECMPHIAKAFSFAVKLKAVGMMRTLARCHDMLKDLNFDGLDLGNDLQHGIEHGMSWTELETYCQTTFGSFGDVKKYKLSVIY